MYTGTMKHHKISMRYVWWALGMLAAVVLTLQVLAFVRHTPPGGDAAGFITAQNPAGFTIETRDTRSVQVRVDTNTQIHQAREQVSPETLTTGTYVVIVGEREGDVVHARMIRVLEDGQQLRAK